MRHGNMERNTQSSITSYKLTIYLLAVFVFVGCALKPHDQAGKDFPSTELKFSAYTWHQNENTDSWDFYLANYLEIDSNGHFVLMRHEKFAGRMLYFSGHFTDATFSQIKGILQNRTYENDYTWKVESGSIYDGFTYTIDYRGFNRERKVIQFIPNNSPEPIRILRKILDSICYETNTDKLDTLFIDDYACELKKSFRPSLLPKVKPTVKFSPPITK